MTGGVCLAYRTRTILPSVFHTRVTNAYGIEDAGNAAIAVKEKKKVPFRGAVNNPDDKSIAFPS